MPKQHLNPANMHTPTGYSHVVKAGDTIYISGQVPVAPDGSIVGVDNPAAQAEQIYQNLQTALASVGASVRDVVKTTTYIVNPDCIDAVREARARYFGENPPTSTLVVISRLARPEFLIEIEAIAYVG
jgi:enamine deaminase RidA (YjgF/YER057c/UK114 family)